MPYNSGSTVINSGSTVINGGRNPCTTGMYNDYVSSNTSDPRNNKCVYYTSDPKQVETLAHYNWRNSAPSTKIADKTAAGMVMSIAGGIFGFIFGIALAINSGPDDDGNRNWPLIVILIILTLGLIATCVIGIVFWATSSESDADKAAREEEQAKYKASEPAVMYELTP